MSEQKFEYYSPKPTQADLDFKEALERNRREILDTMGVPENLVKPTMTLADYSYGGLNDDYNIVILIRRGFRL